MAFHEEDAFSSPPASRGYKLCSPFACESPSLSAHTMQQQRTGAIVRRGNLLAFEIARRALRHLDAQKPTVSPASDTPSPARK